MLTNVHTKSLDELYRTPIVQQTAFWSVVKQKLGEKTLAVHYSSRASDLFGPVSYEKYINSDLLVIIKRVMPGYSMAYVPYGPELEPSAENQGAFLEELAECMRSFLPKNCINIRFDLCWESYWSDGESLSEPSINAQELRFNINTNKWNFRKSMFNNLPSSTMFVDLKPDTRNIIDLMKPKTRYNIGLAERKNVVVKQMGIESLPLWYQLYEQTAIRNNIFLNDIKYFEAVLTAQTNDARSPAEVILLMAEYDSMPLAAMFLIISGNRGSYLYGASSSEHRNKMATYALQWAAMNISKKHGCTEYDMFGVSPNPDPDHPLNGLYKFKSGFGGELFHRLGCWDYPLCNDQYQILKSIELNQMGFHLN
ncbi:MAG TPA: peptidoglycan bridge formation glycyltransferase FemA/FemB family protein [Bacteroidales bacterium]|nr:peptidoglycan bridge formation glycyltransferase FemA/FemB family protein [Bacteroidales bacterium]